MSGLRDYWMEFTEIKAGLYKKNSDILVMATVNEFRGQIYVHIREHRFDGDTGNYYPTSKGYAMKEHEIDTVIEALQEASEIIALHNRNKILIKEEQLEFDFDHGE